MLGLFLIKLIFIYPLFLKLPFDLTRLLPCKGAENPLVLIYQESVLAVCPRQRLSESRS